MRNKYKEYEIVEVAIPNNAVPEAEVGDIGTILMVLESDKKEVAYEVESVQKDGYSKWVGTFQEKHLKPRE